MTASAQPREPRRRTTSALTRGAGARLLVASVALAGLWAAVAWALSA